MANQCVKRAFGSKHGVLASLSKLGHSVHAYRCNVCFKWHIAKRDRRRALDQ